jgi:hypothetical protein
MEDGVYMDIKAIKAFHKVNDGSSAQPKLELQQSWWALYGLGNGERELTIEEKFEKIAEAGFTGILGRLPEPRDAERWRNLLDEYHFSFGVHSFPREREDLQALLIQAKEFGVQYVNSQVANAFVTGEAATKLLSELIEEASTAQLPFFVETHRGKVTQDLLRTVDYVKAIEALRLTIDLSHYVAAGELVNAQAAALAEPFFDVLLQRTSSIHARISNGEQIQVDIGPHGEHPMVPVFTGWWEKGMSYWLQEAQPGDILPFVVELGPWPYSFTIDEDAVHGKEMSDRWQQSLVFKRLAEEAWARANSLNTK